MTADRASRSGEVEAVPLSANEQILHQLREALASGAFTPGQKIKIRDVAAAYGTSMTPVRAALSRLVEQGALEDDGGKSLRVPLMTLDRWHEILDMRIALEGLAIERAASRIDAAALAELRHLAGELAAARRAGDVERDRTLIARFQLGAYSASGAPLLVTTIERFWLLTGPYLNLIFPDYVQTVPHGWRERLCDMLQAGEAAAARAEIERDLRDARDHVAGLADPDGLIRLKRATPG